MDYKINIYPSSERELNNIKVDNKEKTIKAVQVNKIRDVYKKRFGAAVQKFNDYALNGRVLSDYYKAVLDSNIPEVYRISVVVRYDLANPNEVQLIQKSFTDFRKKLEEHPWMATVAVYWMSVDEFKELDIFFVPVSDGYVTGLGTRNDLIDVTKKNAGSQENWNILKAMPVFVDQVDAIWRSSADSQIVSQDDLEKKAHIERNDPTSLHSIEIGMLKENMNHLQRITHENQMLEAQVDEEKRRIQKELIWTKESVPLIKKAEQERLDAIERARLDAARAEKEKIAQEQREKEERRRAEVARQQEALRLKEQARKNYGLRSVLEQDNSAFAAVMSGVAQQPAYTNPDLSANSPFYSIDGVMPVDMNKQAAPAAPAAPVMDEPEAPPATIDYGYQYTPTLPNEVLSNKIQQHIEWMSNYGINETTSANMLPKESLGSIQRLVIKGEVIVGFRDTRKYTLVGAQIFDCIFEDCEFTTDIYASVFVNCQFINCRVVRNKLSGCGLKNITANNGLVVDHVEFRQCTIIDSDFTTARFVGCTSAMPTKYSNLDFSNAQFQDCDMKRNVFESCQFNNTVFDTCDARATFFNNCNKDTIQNINSMI